MAFEQTFRDPVADRAAFEALLVAYGFAPGRARAIATKGFGISGTDEDAIGALVTGLRGKTAVLALEAKGLGRVQIPANTGMWGSWTTLATVNPTEPRKFRLSITPHVATSRTSARYDVEVRYASPTGIRTDIIPSHADGFMGQHVYDIPAGMQSIQVRAKSYGALVYLWVAFVPVRD